MAQFDGHFVLVGQLLCGLLGGQLICNNLPVDPLGRLAHFLPIKPGGHGLKFDSLGNQLVRWAPPNNDRSEA